MQTDRLHFRQKSIEGHACNRGYPTVHSLHPPICAVIHENDSGWLSRKVMQEERGNFEVVRVRTAFMKHM